MSRNCSILEKLDKLYECIFHVVCKWFTYSVMDFFHVPLTINPVIDKLYTSWYKPTSPAWVHISKRNFAANKTTVKVLLTPPKRHKSIWQNCNAFACNICFNNILFTIDWSTYYSWLVSTVTYRSFPFLWRIIFIHRTSSSKPIKFCWFKFF